MYRVSLYRTLIGALLCALSFGPASARSSDEKPAAPLSTEQLNGGPRPVIRAAAPPVIGFRSKYPKGTILIDTKRRRLVYVLSPSRAYLYPISVGRAGFQWVGTHKVTAKRNWPDWHPPAEMRERDPKLPVKMTGGLNNPLGAKALYLGSTLYRIHGTNNTRSIGRAASSGCFRMRNEHVTHLGRITRVGAKVVVVNALPRRLAKSFSKSSKRRAKSKAKSRSRSASRAVQTRRTATTRRRLTRTRPAQRPRRMAWRRSILGTN